MSSVKASLEAIYNMFRDEDGSGVSRNKCKAFLWSAGHEVEDERQLDQILSRYTDAAGKGKDGSVAMLTKSQFMAFVQGSVTVSHDDETIEDSFFELLQPGAETLSVERLKTLLAQHGEQMPADDVEQLIAHVDPAGTGVVSFEQFKEIFQ